MKKILFIISILFCSASYGQLITNKGVKVDTAGLLAPTLATKQDTSSAAKFVFTGSTNNNFPRFDSANNRFLNNAAQWTTSTNDIYNANSGNIGIGTSTPNSGAKFSINKTGGATFWMTNQNGSSNMSNAAVLGDIEFAGWFNGSENDLSRIRGVYLGDGSSRLGGTAFWTRTYTGNREAMRITPQSNLLIGGTTEDSAAILNISTTTRGILIPRMTTTQMNAIPSPTAGLIIMNTTDSALYQSNISGWRRYNPGTQTVANGGTGLSTLTTYRLLAAGTTSTGNLQQISGTGTTGQVLVSNGAGALPTWQTTSSTVTIIDSPQHTFDSTKVTYTAGTSPTVTVGMTYQWTQVGHMVTARFNFLYSVAGATMTVAFIKIPSDMPVPAVPTGYATNDYTYIDNGTASTASSGAPGGATRGAVFNASPTQEVRLVLTSGAYKSVYGTVTYWTP